ncbi:MAG: DUF4760 domain-containing protein [Pseudaminobacter sp.]|nr:DUF4760 domain-containing protein [Pseudaminobacter sp.]
MEPTIAVLIAAGLATTGWIYAARKARTLARKQHTINVLLQASFNKEFLEARNALSPHLKACVFPEDVSRGENEPLRAQFRSILNHYEFVAAALRNGDFAERLMFDSERASAMALYKCCETYIWNQRSNRDRMALYEHLEWLYIRWEKEPPGRIQRCFEFLRGAPLYGKRNSTK